MSFVQLLLKVGHRVFHWLNTCVLCVVRKLHDYLSFLYFAFNRGPYLSPNANHITHGIFILKATMIKPIKKEDHPKDTGSMYATPGFSSCSSYYKDASPLIRDLES